MAKPRLPSRRRQRAWRIVESAMDNAGRAEENRAGLVRGTANRDNDIETGVSQLVDRLAPVAGNVDADLIHYFYGQRIQSVGFDAGAVRFNAVTSNVPAESLCHLAAAGVAGTQETNSQLLGSINSVAHNAGLRC